MSDGLIDVIAIYLFGLKGALAAVACLIALSSLDDFFIDMIFWLRRLYRSRVVYRRRPRQNCAALAPRDPQWMAVMIPAWQEAEVIAGTLERALNGIDYDNYVIFVGLYPNDPATAQAVASVARRHDERRLVQVITRRHGPTTKADCLNEIYAATHGYEQTHNIRFAAYVLHDAEDAIHPRAFKVFNHLIPAKAMVQLPVVPLPRRWFEWVGGHYLDEFAESHCKDLVVREALTGGVPSAGVGCAFSRHALRLAAQSAGGNPFNPNSITEDYELALRLRHLGLASAFVRIEDSANRRGQAIATCEYFPADIQAAVRQKARWLLGIALQGWENLRWRGGLAQRYMLLRDRKALFTAQLNMAAYFIAANIILLWLAGKADPKLPHFLSLVDQGSVTWRLLWINLGFLLNRLAQRALCVGRVYGWRQALLSPPRQFAANLVNFLASLRAIRLYIRAKRRRQAVAWDKTRHEPAIPFPQPPF